jgi:general transcription factor 3C polypeptide 3 (transcription factor C subunit 4)
MRAYALNPANPMLNLTIGLNYIHQGLKTPSGIKNQDILQALTFIFRYYDLRKTSLHLEERLEAHYNVGRTYQLLGLSHLAVQYYVKVLDEAEGGIGEDFVTNTAFNLQSLYALAGNMELARSVTRKYLVI